MPITTRRSTVAAAAAALFTVWASAASGQVVPPTSNPSQGASGSQAGVKTADDDKVGARGAGLQVINLPSTLRLPRHGSNFLDAPLQWNLCAAVLEPVG
jgi:hypothetical protein